MIGKSRDREDQIRNLQACNRLSVSVISCEIEREKGSVREKECERDREITRYMCVREIVKERKGTRVIESGLEIYIEENRKKLVRRV